VIALQFYKIKLLRIKSVRVAIAQTQNFMWFDTRCREYLIVDGELSSVP